MVLNILTDKIPIVRLERLKLDTMTTEAVYKFLKEKNRPFSPNDVATALEKEHNKNATIKALEKLADNGRIFVKVNGKQKVYCVLQDGNQNIDELKRIERDLQQHASDQNRKLQELEIELKTQEAALSSFKCAMSYEEANKEMERLKENNRELTAKLDELMENCGKKDLSQVKKKIESSLKLYNQEYLKRKRLCNDVLDAILESYPGSKKQLYDEIGIDPV